MTNQLVTNVYGFTTNAINPATEEVYTLFDGFDAAGLFTNLTGAVGAFLGTTLAAHIVMPHRPEGAIGEQIGGTIGTMVGAFLPAPIPVAEPRQRASVKERNPRMRRLTRPRRGRARRRAFRFRNGSLQKRNGVLAHRSAA